jgi:tetratricopeptide (TPR) repeat protein
VRCPYCDTRVPEGSPVCPVCGFAVGRRRRSERDSVDLDRTGARSDSPGRLWYFALALLASALLSGTLLLGLTGAERGIDIRRQRGRELSEEYYARGMTHLEQSNYLLALAEFEEAVRLAPDNSEALEQLGLLQAFLGEEAVAAGGVSSEALLNLYGEARALYSQEDWAEAIVKLEQLRRVDPEYRAQEVAAMLFDAYRGQSTMLLESGELEDAMSLLDSALELKPDDPDTAELHQWLTLYMDGLAHWGVDWEKAVGTLRELYELNPSFLDVGRRLHDALLSLGEVYAGQGAWCTAESQYAEAMRVMPSEAASAAHAEALNLCVQAVAEASPSVVASAVPTATVTATATGAPVGEAGSFVGQFLGYDEADPTAMRIRVCVANASGQAVPGTGVEVSTEGWRSDPSATEADGCCEFAGLTQELVFTVELTELKCVPVQVSTRWGTEAQVRFVQR